jgi:hypothetical protein
MRKVLFTDNDGNIIRTELFFSGSILNPPSIVLFKRKLYYYSGSGIDCNFYREVKDSFEIIEEN